jgi:hypothetical protein
MEAFMRFPFAAVASALPLAALAQPVADPAEPRAAAPSLRYESAFADYRPFKDGPPAPWKEVNDALKGASGHSAHPAPKAQTPGPAGEKSPQPAKPAEHKH